MATHDRLSARKPSRIPPRQESVLKFLRALEEFQRANARIVAANQRTQKACVAIAQASYRVVVQIST